MPFVRIALAVLTSLIFASSVSAGLFGSSWQEKADAADACFSAINNDAALAPINAKLARRSPTLSQLADESVPSDLEIQLLQDRAAKEQPCRQMMYKAVREHHPWFESAFQIRFFQIDLVYVQLLKRRITFGNANRLMNESYLEFSVREDRYFQARSDADRRAIAQGFPAQQNPVIPPGTGRIACRWVGSTLYCDPY